MNTFVWLLKREYWEHRGGFLWAPLITGGVILLLTLMGLAVGEVTARRAGVVVNDVRIADITGHMTPEQLAQLGAGLDTAMYGMAMLISSVLAFVLFFYLVGALYDDRRDRSVLFWKSLPISDLQTVLSKIVSATLVAPILAILAAFGLMLGFLVLLSVFVAVHGVNPITTIWMTASPLAVTARLLALVPLNALWALPCIGWLLTASAFARRAPFLWATVVPVGLGLVVTWTDLLRGLHLPDLSIWKHVVARVLFGIAPGSWLGLGNFRAMRHVDGPQDVANALFSWERVGEVLQGPELWIGVAAGVALIVAAVWLRRWRDDG